MRRLAAPVPRGSRAMRSRGCVARERAHVGIAAHLSTVRCSVGMSLSPRPERPRITRLPGLAARPALARRRSACAVSSAGRMPSSCAAFLQRLQRLVVVGAIRTARGPIVMQQRVLGPDARIVEAGGDRVGLLDLPVLVLQQQRIAALQHAGRAVGERRGVLAEARAAAARLDADDLHAAIRHERMEHADRIRAAADAGEHRVGQAARRARGSARAPRGR